MAAFYGIFTATRGRVMNTLRSTLEGSHSMQQITTTFDRVFDVVASQTPYRHGGTLFSFEAGGHNEYGVLVAGNPVVCSGMTVTAILKEPGDWQSLMCWRNHETGEIAFGGREPPPSRIFSMILFGVMTISVLIMGFRESPWFVSCGAIVALSYLAGEAFAIRRMLAARALLNG
jgi:hypothetical protein